jgi:hypothetical protein
MRAASRADSLNTLLASCSPEPVPAGTSNLYRIAHSLSLFALSTPIEIAPVAEVLRPFRCDRWNVWLWPSRPIAALQFFGRFSNRPCRVKHLQTIRRRSVDVSHGFVLRFGIGIKPFHHGIRRRGGTIYQAALPSNERQVQATKRTHLIHRPARDIIPPLSGARVSSYRI